MLGAIEVGNEVSEDEYEAAVPALRQELIELQHELRERGFAVLVHLVGTDVCGCEEVYDRLHEWMDARYIRAEAFDLASEEERERPLFWRYWRTLPANGLVGFHYGAWSLGALASARWRRRCAVRSTNEASVCTLGMCSASRRRSSTAARC